MKKMVWLMIIALAFAACGDDPPGGDDANGEHWLISSQRTSTVKDGILDSNYSYTSYSWIAYRRNGTDYEEKYTTGSESSSSNSYSIAEYHNTRNGQTSLSTTETTTRNYNNNTGVYTLSPTTTSSTTATYDSASGLTSSSTTVSSAGTTTTYYTIELLIDLDGAKTYKHTPVGSNWYNIIKIQDGRTLETSYYNEESGLISTTTYIPTDNAEIRAKLPDFTLSSARYFPESYAVKNTYQTAEVLRSTDSSLEIRVKTFYDSVLSSQTDSTYRKINPDDPGEPPLGIDLDDDGNNVSTTEVKRWGDYWYGENGKIYGWTGTGSNVVIPDQINGKPVTGIGYMAFVGRYKLVSVTIPNSVTSIEYQAFSGCWSLASVTIPNSVTSIGNMAFSGCISLAGVTIPNSVTSIGPGAFGDCIFTSVIIPNGVTSIKEGTFSACRNLTSITIPDGVTSIGNWAFGSCNSLASVIIPEGVTSIGDWAFSDCKNLTGITIPASVTSIGEYAFARCTSLTSVTFQGTIPATGIDDNAFFPPYDLREKYLEGGVGTYTWDDDTSTWTKQE